MMTRMLGFCGRLRGHGFDHGRHERSEQRESQIPCPVHHDILARGLRDRTQRDRRVPERVGRAPARPDVALRRGSPGVSNVGGEDIRSTKRATPQSRGSDGPGRSRSLAGRSHAGLVGRRPASLGQSLVASGNSLCAWMMHRWMAASLTEILRQHRRGEIHNEKSCECRKDKPARDFHDSSPLGRAPDRYRACMTTLRPGG